MPVWMPGRQEEDEEHAVPGSAALEEACEGVGPTVRACGDSRSVTRADRAGAPAEQVRTNAAWRNKETRHADLVHRDVLTQKTP